jgi:hypothetical protein
MIELPELTLLKKFYRDAFIFFSFVLIMYVY